MKFSYANMYFWKDQDTESDMTWKGFKIVGDNFDKNVKRRHQTINRQTLSLHYFHAFAVKDRINYTTLDDTAPYKPDHR